MRGNTCYVAVTLNIYIPALHRAVYQEEKTSPLFHLRSLSSISSPYHFPKNYFSRFQRRNCTAKLESDLFIRNSTFTALKLESFPTNTAGKLLKTGYSKLAPLSMRGTSYFEQVESNWQLLS